MNRDLSILPILEIWEYFVKLLPQEDYTELKIFEQGWFEKNVT